VVLEVSGSLLDLYTALLVLVETLLVDMPVADSVLLDTAVLHMAKVDAVLADAVHADPVFLVAVIGHLAILDEDEVEEIYSNLQARTVFHLNPCGGLSIFLPRLLLMDADEGHFGNQMPIEKLCMMTLIYRELQAETDRYSRRRPGARECCGGITTPNQPHHPRPALACKCDYWIECCRSATCRSESTTGGIYCSREV
jgi:hypothetical protein